jgi:hypothetical protein
MCLASAVVVLAFVLAAQKARNPEQKGENNSDQFVLFGQMLCKMAGDRCQAPVLGCLPLCFWRFLLVREKKRLEGFALTSTDHQQTMGQKASEHLQGLSLLDGKTLSAYGLDFTELGSNVRACIVA